MNLFRFIPFAGLRNCLWNRHVRRKFGACGERVIVSMSGSYSWPDLFIGSDVHIGTRSIFWTDRSRIVIGNRVLMAPEVCILSGDHHSTVLDGNFIYGDHDVESIPGENKDVVLEDDIWVGARAVILKGVRIGRGAVIGAAAVVTKSVAPYCVVAGNPARPIKMRGSVKQILAHERTLYPAEARLTREAIQISLGEIERAKESRFHRHVVS